MADNNKSPFLVLLLLPILTRASVDLYLDGEQTEALFGIRRAEGIYYVRDGVVNHYALGFQEQVVPAELSYLLFHWRSSSNPNGTATPQTTTTSTTLPPPEEIPESDKRDDEKEEEDFKDSDGEEEDEEGAVSNPVAYSIHVIHTPGAAMRRPALNVSAVGVVPEEEEAFAVHFPCTGLASGAVDFLLQIKFAFGKTNTESLNFKGKKVCKADPIRKVHKNSNNSTRRKNNISIRVVDDWAAKTRSPQQQEEETTVTTEGPENRDDKTQDSGLGNPIENFRDPNSTTILALGTAAGAVALMFVLLTVLYATGKKRAPHHTPNTTLNLRGSGDSLPPHYAVDFMRQKAVAAARKGNGGGGYTYRFNGGMGLAGTGNTLTRNCETAAVQKAAEGSVRGPGSYATLASFTNVPLSAPVGHNQADNSDNIYRNGSAGGRGHHWPQHYKQQQQASQPATNSRWLKHYGSNQSSIWSSSQTMTSTMRETMGRHQEKSSSQSTIFGRRPPPDPAATLDPHHAPTDMTMSSAGSASLPKKRHPQQNSLVLENGMLKLCPQNQEEEGHNEMEERIKSCAASDTRLDQVVRDENEDDEPAQQRRRPTDTLKSNKTEEEILEMQRQLLETAAPLYQTPEGFLAFAPPSAGGVGVGRNSSSPDSSPTGPVPVAAASHPPPPPFALYTPQIYPHLMPQNIAHKRQQKPQRRANRRRQQQQQQQQQVQHEQQHMQHFLMDEEGNHNNQRLPRSTSGGSVLV